MPGFVSWMLGFVSWVLGLVFWVSGIVFRGMQNHVMVMCHLQDPEQEQQLGLTEATFCHSSLRANYASLRKYRCRYCRNPYRKGIF